MANKFSILEGLCIAGGLTGLTLIGIDAYLPNKPAKAPIVQPYETYESSDSDPSNFIDNHPLAEAGIGITAFSALCAFGILSVKYSTALPF